MPLPPIPLEDFRRFATRKWTEATQPLVDDLSHTGWVMDAQRTLDDAVRQAQSWMPQPAPPPPAAPPTLEPFEAEGQPELMGPPSPTLGQRVGMGAQSFVDTAQATAQDWTSRAQGAISGLSSSWDADLERIRREREASEAQFPTPQETGPAGFTLPQTGTPQGEQTTTALAEAATGGTPALPWTPPGGPLETAGVFLEEQRQATRDMEARDRARDEMLLDLTPSGRALTGEDRERPLEALRFAREAGQSGLGVRRGGRALPRLSPEQLAQRARDGAAEQRVFDAIQRLWRRGPEGEAVADDLRFLAVGKGEPGEAAAREYLAGKGLGDVLPAGSRAVSLAGVLTSLPERGGDVLEGAGAFLEQQRQATQEFRERQRAQDERLLNLSPQGQALAGEEREQRLEALRFAREAGEGTGLGLRGNLLPRLLGPGRTGLTAAQANEVLSSMPLTSPASQLRNLTGGLFRTIERLALRAASGRPLEAADEALTALREAPGALRQAPGAFRRGPTQQTPGVTGAPLSGALASAPDTQAQVLTSGIRANAAADEFWRTINEAGALRTGQRRGLTGADLAEFVEQAGDFATVAGKNSPLATSLNSLRELASKPGASPAERVVGTLAQGFAPYVGMPERLLVSSLQTVTGPVAAPLELAIRRFMGRPGAAGTTEQLVGRAVLGTVVDGVLANQAASGNLYGRPPDNPSRRREMERQGAQWNSIRIGGTWVPLSYFGTFGMAASLLADATHAWQDAGAEGEGMGEQAKDALNRSMSWLLDESYLSDFAEFLKATSDDRFTTAAAGLAGGIASRPLAPLTSAVGAADPYARETATEAGQLARIVPGGRARLPTKVDPYTGEDVRRKGSGLGRYLGLNTGEELTPVERELAAHGVTVARPSQDYAGVKQTREAQRAVQRALGSEIGEAARTTIRSRAYQEASDAEKTKLLERAVRQARQLADVRLGDTVERDAKRQAAYEYLAVPRYEGVSARLSADEIRRENLRTAAARSALTEAKQRYRDNPDKGRAELLRSDPETVKLAENRPPLSASELRRKREQIDAKHGLTASGDPLSDAEGGEETPG